MALNRTSWTSRSLLMIGAATILATVLLIVRASGGGAGDDISVRPVLGAVPKPGPEWTPGGIGLNLDTPKPLTLDRGSVWVNTHPTPGVPTYLVTWQTKVRAGDEKLRCTEAASWLSQVGKSLPGRLSPDFANTTPPPGPALVDSCLAALADSQPDAISSTDLGTWPNTIASGHQFSACVEAYTTPTTRILSASTVAIPTGD